jgi:hypothetical protein
MRQPDYIPQSDSDFLTWATLFIRNLGNSFERFGFPEERYVQLKQLFDDFAQKYTLATSPGTRTAPAVLAKNSARNALKKAIRQAVKEHLAHNRLLSEEDRVAQKLPIYKTTRTPAPVAETYPEVMIDSRLLCHLIIHFYDHGESLSKAKPAGQHGVEICWVISDVPLVNVEDLIHSSFSTTTPLRLEFKGHERGQTVYFALCWVNIRGKKGPWSAIKSAIIP